jgi:hypothetical protein
VLLVMAKRLSAATQNQPALLPEPRAATLADSVAAGRAKTRPVALNLPRSGEAKLCQRSDRVVVAVVADIRGNDQFEHVDPGKLDLMLFGLGS